jgi:hypothetical protein
LHCFDHLVIASEGTSATPKPFLEAHFLDAAGVLVRQSGSMKNTKSSKSWPCLTAVLACAEWERRGSRRRVGNGKRGNDCHGINVEMEAGLFGMQVGWRRRLWSVAAVVKTVNGRCGRASKR